MLSATEILLMYSEMGVQGHASMNVSDSTYGVPTEEYIVGPFADFYQDKMRDMNLETWEDQNDCDNFAWLFFTDAQWAHYATNKSTAEGLAIGVCYFMAGARTEGGGGGGHAINTAVVGDEGNRRIIFIEPQYAACGKPCILQLTPEEITSIWLINF